MASTRVYLNDDELYVLDEAVYYFKMSHADFGDDPQDVDYRDKHLRKVDDKIQVARKRIEHELGLL